MSKAGSRYLDNAVMEPAMEQVQSYQTTVQDALYELYQKMYILAASNRYRGVAADKFKAYLTNGPINIATEFLDVTSDLTMNLQTFAAAFRQYEPSGTGRVDESTLDSISTSLGSKKSNLQGLLIELASALSQASAHIETTGLNDAEIESAYKGAYDGLETISTGLAEVDNEALAYAQKMHERITRLNTMIAQVMATCYNGGCFNPDGAGSMTEQPWYQRAGNVTLRLMLQEDPFSYVAGETSIAEDQWAKGLYQDVYAYGGYSLISASGEAGTDGLSAFAKGKAQVVEINGYAQFTDFLSGKVEAKAGYGEGDAKIGWTDEYKGFHLDGEIGIAKAEGKLQLGTDDFNGYVKGDAEFCTADGKAAFEFEDDGEFKIGAIGEATLAKAKVGIGSDGIGGKVKWIDEETGKKKEKRLLRGEIGLKATAGGGAGLFIEGKKVVDTDFIDVRTVTVEFDFSLLIGVEGEFTLPYPWF